MSFELNWKTGIGMVCIILGICIIYYFSVFTTHLSQEQAQDQTQGTTKPSTPSTSTSTGSFINTLTVEPKIDITDDQIVYISLIVNGGTPPYKFFVERSPYDVKDTLVSPSYQSEAKNIAEHNDIPDGTYQYKIKDMQSVIIFTPKIIIYTTNGIRKFRFE
jgi:hypothetical protein